MRLENCMNLRIVANTYNQIRWQQNKKNAFRSQKKAREVTLKWQEYENDRYDALIKAANCLPKNEVT